MLSKKYIHVLSVVLVVLAVSFVGAMLLWPPESVETLGETAYGDGQTVFYSSNDYYTDYTQEDFLPIRLMGDSVSVISKNVSVSGRDVTIRAGGVYELSGTLIDGSITIDAEDGAPVRLVLNNAEITSLDSAVIHIEQAAKTIISTAPGSVNTLADGSDYKDTATDATLYSKDDLVLNGEGTLVIQAAYADGIKGNDGLKITGGLLQVTATDEAITANDYIALSGGSLTLRSGGDAIKCVNNDDATLGFIALSGGSLDIVTETDAIYAGSDMYIEDISATISAGDDGVHAEGNLVLNGGTIEITECYEGLEGAYITINDGNYTIKARDDAFNAVGEGTTPGDVMGRPGGMGRGSALSSAVYLTINGGTIYAETDGDGLDSNAAAVINGGYVEVYGPENNGNSTLDFDGGFTINGGTVLAAGSAGMAESPSASSRQNVIVATLKKTYEAGTSFALLDESGSTVARGTSQKRFNWLCISSDLIELNKTYTVTVDGSEEAVVTATESVTSVQNTSGGIGGMGGNRGGRGRMPGEQGS